jgi:hypothetical protein
VPCGGGDEGDRRDGAKGTRQRERERKDARVDFVAFETVAAAGGCHRHRRQRRRRVSSRRLAIRRVRAKTTNAAVARARAREDVAVRRVYSAEPGVQFELRDVRPVAFFPGRARGVEADGLRRG